MMQSLAAAIRVCKQCESMSPAREWRLLDRVTIDRCTAGQTVLARFDGIPATDSRGRIAHVRGIYVNASADFTMAAANPAVTAYQLRSLFSSSFLRDITGHTYLNDVDARSILDDQYVRFGRQLQWPALQSGVESIALPPAAPENNSTITADAGVALNIGVGTELRNVSFYLPFQSPGKHPLRGLVPLAAFQRVSNNALTIRIGTEIAGAPAGFTFNNLYVEDFLAGAVRDGMDIWVDIVWLNGLVVDSPWELSEYTLNELSGVLRYPERLTEYAAARFFPDDDAALAGQFLVNDLDGISITTAGFAQRQGQAFDDAAFQGMLDEMSRSDGALLRSSAAQSLPMVGAQGYTMLQLLPYRHRQAAAGGAVNFRYNDRGATATWTRYLHRTVQCHTEARATTIEKRLAQGPCAAVGTTHEGTACHKVNKFEPAILIPKQAQRR